MRYYILSAICLLFAGVAFLHQNISALFGWTIAFIIIFNLTEKRRK